jgi:hypothetical protein
MRYFPGHRTLYRLPATARCSGRYGAWCARKAKR